LSAGRTGPLPAEHVQAIGVKRRGYGNAGKLVRLRSNHIEVNLKQGTVYHYDGKYLLYSCEEVTYESFDSVTI
jgi:eukaryotic translation initiation factor 2C